MYVQAKEQEQQHAAQKQQELQQQQQVQQQQLQQQQLECQRQQQEQQQLDLKLREQQQAEHQRKDQQQQDQQKLQQQVGPMYLSGCLYSMPEHPSDSADLLGSHATADLLCQTAEPTSSIMRHVQTAGSCKSGPYSQPVTSGRMLFAHGALLKMSPHAS